MHPERNEISPFRNGFMPHNEKAFFIAVIICNLITRHVVPSKGHIMLLQSLLVWGSTRTGFHS